MVWKEVNLVPLEKKIKKIDYLFQKNTPVIILIFLTLLIIEI